MNRIPSIATAVVALNLVVATVHGLSHSHAEVVLEPWQMAFVVLAVYALPVLAVVLYWTPFRRTGAGSRASAASGAPPWKKEKSRGLGIR